MVGVLAALVALFALATPQCPVPMAVLAAPTVDTAAPPCHGTAPVPSDATGNAPCCPLTGCLALAAPGTPAVGSALAGAVPVLAPRRVAIALCVSGPVPRALPHPHPPPTYQPRPVVLLI